MSRDALSNGAVEGSTPRDFPQPVVIYGLDASPQTASGDRVAGDVSSGRRLRAEFAPCGGERSLLLFDGHVGAAWCLSIDALLVEAFAAGVGIGSDLTVVHAGGLSRAALRRVGVHQPSGDTRLLAAVLLPAMGGSPDRVACVYDLRDEGAEGSNAATEEVAHVGALTLRVLSTGSEGSPSGASPAGAFDVDSMRAGCRLVPMHTAASDDDEGTRRIRRQQLSSRSITGVGRQDTASGRYQGRGESDVFLCSTSGGQRLFVVSTANPPPENAAVAMEPTTVLKLFVDRDVALPPMTDAALNAKCAQSYDGPCSSGRFTINAWWVATPKDRIAGVAPLLPVPVLGLREAVMTALRSGVAPTDSCASVRGCDRHVTVCDAREIENGSVVVTLRVASNSGDDSAEDGCDERGEDGIRTAVRRFVTVTVSAEGVASCAPSNAAGHAAAGSFRPWALSPVMMEIPPTAISGAGPPASYPQRIEMMVPDDMQDHASAFHATNPFPCDRSEDEESTTAADDDVHRDNTREWLQARRHHRVDILTSLLPMRVDVDAARAEGGDTVNDERRYQSQLDSILGGLQGVGTRAVGRSKYSQRHVPRYHLMVTEPSARREEDMMIAMISTSRWIAERGLQGQASPSSTISPQRQEAREREIATNDIRGGSTHNGSDGTGSTTTIPRRRRAAAMTECAARCAMAAAGCDGGRSARQPSSSASAARSAVINVAQPAADAARMVFTRQSLLIGGIADAINARFLEWAWPKPLTPQRQEGLHGSKDVCSTHSAAGGIAQCGIEFSGWFQLPPPSRSVDPSRTCTASSSLGSVEPQPQLDTSLLAHRWFAGFFHSLLAAGQLSDAHRFAEAVNAPAWFETLLRMSTPRLPPMLRDAVFKRCDPLVQSSFHATLAVRDRWAALTQAQGEQLAAIRKVVPRADLFLHSESVSDRREDLERRLAAFTAVARSTAAATTSSRTADPALDSAVNMQIADVLELAYRRALSGGPNQEAQRVKRPNPLTGHAGGEIRQHGPSTSKPSAIAFATDALTEAATAYGSGGSRKSPVATAPLASSAVGYGPAANAADVLAAEISRFERLQQRWDGIVRLASTTPRRRRDEGLPRDDATGGGLEAISAAIRSDVL